jgi:hypothetical protein
MARKQDRSDTAAPGKPNAASPAIDSTGNPGEYEPARITINGVDLEEFLLKHPPSQQWSGTAEEWLLGHGDCPGAFVEDPWNPQRERFYALKRPDDYCRRIARKGKAAGVPKISVGTVKTLYSRRPNRVQPPK